MMQAIGTRFLGPTNFRGARVVATADVGRLTVSWDHSKNVDENHTAAAEALARKLGWEGTWIGGGAPGGRGNVYVRLPRDVTDALKYRDGFEVAEVAP